MGRNERDFGRVVIEIINRHAPDVDEQAVIIKPSRDSNFLSVTVTIVATSKAQLNAIYQDLSSHPQVLMAL